MNRTRGRRPRGGIFAPFGRAVDRPTGSGTPGYYLKVARSAMACTFEVFLHPADRARIEAVHDALGEIDRLEAQMSVYRDDSELSLLNRSAAEAPQPVESRLYDLLRLARGIGRDTGGAFDLTAGPLVRAWGFFERRGRSPDAEALESARARTGWDKLAFDDGRRAVAFLEPGVELNLGSIGKGYALDRAAALLGAGGIRSFLIHAGYSSVYASGDSTSPPGWLVGVRDPRAKETSLGSLRLVDQGMSTSGIGEQSFVEGGRRYGHILDPRTGLPSDRNALVSVVAPRAAVAEALSTAFFVMDRAEVRAYCEGHPEVGTMMLAATSEDPDGGGVQQSDPWCWRVSLESAEDQA